MQSCQEHRKQTVRCVAQVDRGFGALDAVLVRTCKSRARLAEAALVEAKKNPQAQWCGETRRKQQSENITWAVETGNTFGPQSWSAKGFVPSKLPITAPRWKVVETVSLKMPALVREASGNKCSSERGLNIHQAQRCSETRQQKQVEKRAGLPAKRRDHKTSNVNRLI